MLSGHAFAAVFARAAHAIAADYPVQQASAHAATTTAAAHAAAHNQVFAAFGSAATSQKTVLTAQLTDPSGTATGTLTFETKTYDGETESKLSVSVTGAVANSTLDVSIGDTVVGQVTTDDSGAGKLVLSSEPEGTQLPLPADFPTAVAAGTAVTVGSLSGTLATPTPSKGGCGDHTGTRLSVQLTDANSTAAATVSFKTKTYDGVTSTKLSVSVTGAAASSSLDVSIDGTVVGQVATDANGASKLVLSSKPMGTQQPLPANFPTTIAAGTTVSVGTLSGALAVSTGSGHYRRHR